MKRILSFLLTMSLLFSSIGFTFGETGIDAYLQTALPKHITIMSESNPQFDAKGQISYGEKIAVFDYSNKGLTATDIYYVPVYESKKPIGYITVSKSDAGEWTSGFGKMFVENTINYNLQNALYKYKLVQSKGQLVATNGVKTYVLDAGFDKSIIDIDGIQACVKPQRTSMFSALFEAEKRTDVAYATASRRASKYLDVDIVLQNGQPICWAACCAAVINYLNGTSYTAEDIVDDVGSETGTWTNMKKAYNNNGLYPSQTGTLNSSGIYSVLSDNEPIHMGMYTSDRSGHSTILRGLNQGVGGDMWYSIIDPNKSSYQTLDIPISAQNNGDNVYYVLNGKKFYWEKSRYGY